MRTFIFNSILWIMFLHCSGCGGGLEITRGLHERLPAGHWTVDGAQMGDSFEAIEQLLGKGEQRGFGNKPVYVFGKEAFAVTFCLAMTAEHVSGRRLLRNGEVVLTVGQGRAAVVSTLGEGCIVNRYSPKTSGMFTIGSVPLWTENYYHDGTNRFHVFVNKNNVIGGIRSTAMDKLPLPQR